jgi:hypothetical protein
VIDENSAAHPNTGYRVKTFGATIVGVPVRQGHYADADSAQRRLDVKLRSANTTGRGTKIMRLGVLYPIRSAAKRGLLKVAVESIRRQRRAAPKAIEVLKNEIGQ